MLLKSSTGAERRRGFWGVAGVPGRPGKEGDTLAQPKVGGRSEYSEREENRHPKDWFEQKLRVSGRDKEETFLGGRGFI